MMLIAPLKSGRTAIPCWLIFCTTHVGHAYNLLVILLLLSASVLYSLMRRDLHSLVKGAKR